jgi:hypothetical protein
MIIMERAVEGENFYDNEEAKSMVADFLFVGIEIKYYYIQ